MLGLGDVFAEAGITEWIVAEFTPFVMAIASNPYALVVGIALITIAARFLIVSQTAFINIFLAFVIPIAITLGINPWVIGMASYTVINVWFVQYQNPVYLAGLLQCRRQDGQTLQTRRILHPLHGHRNSLPACRRAFLAGNGIVLDQISSCVFV